MPVGASILIGLVFGSLAGAIAFVITYSEYEKHKLGRARVLMESFLSAGVAFAFFFAMAVVAGALLARML